jgi:hypothetical protein
MMHENSYVEELGAERTQASLVAMESWVGVESYGTHTMLVKHGSSSP